MAYFMVKCERVREGHSKVTWEMQVQAESTSEARDIAKQKAKMQYSDFKIAILGARKL